MKKATPLVFAKPPALPLLYTNTLRYPLKIYAV